ncbi:hypothetical protein SAY87_020362 [Trapa incisa]|uniref:Uncharacterized protein n=1 Tax=Trapa incisa TaxID=236973 RepID=A0AAN7Q3Q2_9MYRT|nr:hypothetical protein SAY87_020362 [Trapa incisa]
MEENSTSGSTLAAPLMNLERIEWTWYPIYFGVSCAVSALRFLSDHGNSEEENKWSDICDKMLQGSAQLLGLLVWRANKVGVDDKKCFLVEKLKGAEKKIEELNHIRREDAKANEKVVCIFAAHEQSWFNERKKLRQQIGALINEMKFLERKKVEDISKLNEKLKEMEILLEGRDQSLEEEELKNRGLQENLNKAERALEESREAAKTEIWKHKTAFIELVSNQRQLEAEMGRAMRQIEALKEELDSVLEQKEESVLMVQKLSVEIVKMQKDLDQKDKILSAMLRKSKLDTAEKQMLLKEVKVSKAMRKQAELEKERLRTISESNNKLKHGGHRSLRSLLEKKVSSKFEEGLFSGARRVDSTASGSSRKSHDIGEATEKTGADIDSPPLSKNYPPEENGALAIMDNVELENWAQSEAEKHTTLIEQRHQLEVEAFVEQMRLKDEKLEASRWQLLSMEIESKRLRAHAEGLKRDISQFRQSNMKLEALILEREEELGSLKEKLNSQNSLISDWTKVKIIKRRVAEKERERKPCTSTVEVSPKVDCEMEGKEVHLMVQSPEEKTEEMNLANDRKSSLDFSCHVEDLESSSQLLSDKAKNSSSSWRMDLQALGVSYKIKRLNQQLLMLERLMGKQDGSTENVKSKEDGAKSLFSLISLMNKQIGRYQSLQDKTDDLCKRMRGNDLDANLGDPNAVRTRGQKTKMLEHFLEETFQLQRYMVATGQKLMEVQSKVAAGLIGADQQLDKPTSFDMKRFADNVRALFQEVQRGLEVRISRIIGDLEGTIASDGIIHLRM